MSLITSVNVFDSTRHRPLATQPDQSTTSTLFRIGGAAKLLLGSLQEAFTNEVWTCERDDPLLEKVPSTSLSKTAGWWFRRGRPVERNSHCLR
jgi:hypothetical protein